MANLHYELYYLIGKNRARALETSERDLTLRFKEGLPEIVVNDPLKHEVNAHVIDYGEGCRPNLNDLHQEMLEHLSRDQIAVLLTPPSFNRYSAQLSGVSLTLNQKDYSVEPPILPSVLKI